MRALFSLALLSLLTPVPARAHCDSLDGPVIKDARAALEKKDPAAVLKWIAQDREKEIADAFKKTLAVRTKGEEAKSLADRWFFETLVRVHRAGEGEGFTGLKEGGSAEPGLLAADKALETGAGEALAKEMSEAVAEGIGKRFALAMEKKKRMNESVEAGRDYVGAYIDYIHFVEAAHQLTAEGAGHGKAEHNEP